MEFQWEQLAITLLWSGMLIIGLWTKSKPFLIISIIIAIIMFTMNPFRMTTVPIQGIEGNPQFNDIPDKVVVESPSFEDHQRSKMDILKHNQENTHEKIMD